jgi:ATP-dependent Clp protease adaptor protein ClpS
MIGDAMVRAEIQGSMRRGIRHGTNRNRPRAASRAPIRLCAAAADGAATEAMPETETDTETKVREAFEPAWNVIVWNDPVNLMSYVVFVFMKVLAWNRQVATKHMREVHEQGKSCVARDTREKAEHYHMQLQSHGLSVTIAPAED